MKKPIPTLLFFLLSLAGLAAATAQVNEEPLPLKAVRAFENLRLRRPIVFTHAGDGSDRVFVATQQGVIQFFPNDQAVKSDQVQVFLDVEKKVVYKESENEEGLLGLAFHPKYKTNGEYFVYYTTTDGPPHTSVISRFKVSKSDPGKADPKSEEEIMRIPQPFWNHNGGGLAFGPDGYLYISLGDGGAANDPHKNGQNLETVLGKILRIDVDHKDDGKKYAVPKDNPFVGKGKARGEIYAYGLRNVWGLTFDRQTGALWAADVGQDIWEEIDIIVKGGNYGWSVREGMHPFGPQGSGPRADLVDPIWEYNHSVGKSITGGYVYRGKRVPELAGKYLYADYVTGRIWGLTYDEKSKKVTANQPIAAEPSLPIIAFGEDQDGDQYFTTAFGMIYRFVKK